MSSREIQSVETVRKIAKVIGALIDAVNWGQAARVEYEAKYTPERNYQMLIEVYEDAISATYGERHVT